MGKETLNLQTLEYEGCVEVDHCNFEVQNVATNSMHIPMRKGKSQCMRSKAWSHAARQFLSEKDRVDKRGPKQGTQEDRTNRMVNNILAYYCRLNNHNLI